ncbi:MAG: alanine racemase, partial [Bacteroidota bacterium]
GDTPSCSIMDDFTGIDEIRPGNFVFYDAMQYHLGSCKPEQIAVSVACPVVSKNKERCELVIYGGAVHLSKDFITDKNNNRIYGLVAKSDTDEWGAIIPDTKIISVTQEHGIIRTNKTFFESTEIGDVVNVLPVHSCLCANNFSKYFLTTGKWISKK